MDDSATPLYDIVGGDYSEPALRSIAWEGRFLVIGFPAGIAKMPLNLTLLKSCDIRGVFWGAFTAREPEKNAANSFALWLALSPKSATMKGMVIGTAEQMVWSAVVPATIYSTGVWTRPYGYCTIPMGSAK